MCTQGVIFRPHFAAAVVKFTEHASFIQVKCNRKSQNKSDNWLFYKACPKIPTFQLNSGLGRLGSSTNVQSALFNSVPHFKKAFDQSRSALWLWMLFRLNEWL